VFFRLIIFWKSVKFNVNSAIFAWVLIVFPVVFLHFSAVGWSMVVWEVCDWVDVRLASVKMLIKKVGMYWFYGKSS